MKQLHPFAFTILLGLWMSEAACDTTLSGHTVEFRSGQEIEGVTVVVKDANSNQELDSTTSDHLGYYQIEVDGNVEFFNVTYDPPDSDWDPAGRTYLVRVGPIFDLDTAGLTNKQSGQRDSVEQRQHARNTSGYVNAGGNADTAAATVREAISRFGDEYYGIAHHMGVDEAFGRAGIPFP